MSRSSSPSTSRVPAGSSSSSSLERHAVLAHERDRAVVVERHDRHGAGVVDDVPLELAAVGPAERRPHDA